MVRGAFKPARYPDQQIARSRACSAGFGGTVPRGLCRPASVSSGRCKTGYRASRSVVPQAARSVCQGSVAQRERNDHRTQSPIRRLSAKRGRHRGDPARCRGRKGARYRVTRPPDPHTQRDLLNPSRGQTVTSSSAYNVFPDGDTLIPRFREAGDVTLDLLHRDGRVDDRWLSLHPREFELLWRLAEDPGKRLSKRRLLADVWRISYEPETNSVAVHVARVRAKLAPLGLAGILATHSDGGYYLDAPPGPASFRLRTGSRV